MQVGIVAWRGVLYWVDLQKLGMCCEKGMREEGACGWIFHVRRSDVVCIAQVNTAALFCGPGGEASESLDSLAGMFFRDFISDFLFFFGTNISHSARNLDHIECNCVLNTRAI